MSGIGDIFWSFRGDGTKLQADAKTEGAKAGNTLGNSMFANVKKAYSGSNIGQGLVQGLGIAGAFGAVSLVSGAVSALTGIIGDSIKAFNEDQASIAKLNTSLKANVPAWDGNTDAIERTLKARMALGFSDDEQRDSLAVLVAKTHDVTKALEIQAAAMDLARLRGISLADATSAISKGMSGSGRALKDLGIDVKDYASGTEILTAIQKKATGQAAAYAQTNEGKLLVSQIKVGEAMERLGSVMAGPVADGFAAAADALTKIIEAIDGAGDAAANNQDALINLGNLIHDLFKPPEEDPRTFLGALGTGLDGLNNNVGDAAAAINDFWTFWDDHSNLAMRRAKRLGDTFTDLKDTTAADMEGMRGKTTTATVEMSRAMDNTGDTMEANRGRMMDALTKVGKSFTQTAKLSDTANSRMRNSWQRTADYIEARANDLITKAFDPIMAYDDLVATNTETNAQRKTLAIKATTDAQKTAAREARAALDSAMRDTASQLTTLAAAGQTNSNAFKTGLNNLKTYAAGLKGSAKTSVDGAIAEIERLSHIHINPIDVPIRVPVISIKTTYSPTSGPHVVSSQQGWRIYDRGGRPDPFVPALIGRGQFQEMFIPDVPGTIVDHNKTQRMLAGGNTFHLNVTAPEDTSLSSARRWGQVILDEVAAGLREQTARSGA